MENREPLEFRLGTLGKISPLLVAPAPIPFVNFYAIAMGIILTVSIVTGYGRRSKIDD